MFEIFLVMMAAAIQMQPVDDAGAPPPGLAVSEAAPGVATAAEAPPAFLAPAPSSDAPPVFLAPAQQAEAPPAFLAPAQTAEAPPAFLAPAPSGLQAEPQVPTGQFTTATEVRPILNATRGNWIAVRDFNGKDLLYVTHLWSWRCGLLEMRIGVNGAEPQVWPMPPCHQDEAAPNAVKPEDGLPYGEFPQGSIAMIEVRITYDDLGTDSARFNRQGVQIP
ncbi:hypothetical protein LCL97_05585 [Seohaeicola saemankumensis]|nr:hypothetical protein [Seohaeicola saemankumensis]MCA0870284.1 hypothetical protein [Seohaeicola saemankumensis]